VDPTSSITVETMLNGQGSGDYAIDWVNSGLTVRITTAGVITVTNFNVNSKVVDATTYIDIQLSSSVKYSSGGYIEIIAPTGYASWSTSGVVCTAGSGFSGSLTSCTRVDS